MLITSHVLAGRIVGRVLSGRPITALAVGALSHLAMDALPHWSPGNGPGTYETFLRVAKRDGIVGLIAVAVGVASASPRTRPAIAAGILGAAVIDMDKPLVYFFRVNPFPHWFQWLHKVIQDEAPTRMPFEVGAALLLAVPMTRDVMRMLTGSSSRRRAGRRFDRRPLVS